MQFYQPKELPKIMVAPNGVRPMKKDHPKRKKQLQTKAKEVKDQEALVVPKAKIKMMS